MAITRRERRLKIKRRIRGRIAPTAERPRLSVFRSNKEIYAQVIDDTKGITLVSASTHSLKLDKSLPKVEQSKLVGLEIAKRALSAGISKIVFDRNGYLYHGRVKAVAEGARVGGLDF